MRRLAGFVFAGLLVVGSLGCVPGGGGKACTKCPAGKCACKVQGCKKCGKAPCACKGEKVQGCKKCGKAPCACKGAKACKKCPAGKCICKKNK
ncbi:MAG: hypothetical protein ACYTGB_05035 [Planctomycetota bacterium]|jgi:hypothetical protein